MNAVALILIVCAFFSLSWCQSVSRKYLPSEPGYPSDVPQVPFEGLPPLEPSKDSAPAFAQVRTCAGCINPLLEHGTHSEVYQVQ